MALLQSLLQPHYNGAFQRHHYYNRTTTVRFSASDFRAPAASQHLTKAGQQHHRHWVVDSLRGTHIARWVGYPEWL